MVNMMDHESAGEAYNEQTERYLQTESLRELDAHLSLRGVQLATEHKRRECFRNAGKWAGFVALLVTVSAGIRVGGDWWATRQTGNETAVSVCYPSSGATRQVTIQKANLPPDPTDVDIAKELAGQVPGSESCDGNVQGPNQYKSFITLLKGEQTEVSQANLDLPPLMTILNQQTGGVALFVVPVSIDTKASS